MLEDVSELLNYKDQDLTLDHLVEIQKQSATEETEVHEPLCKERPMVVSKPTEGLTQEAGSKVFADTNLNEQRAATTTQGIIWISSYYGNILQKKRYFSLHTSVLDFFKSSSGRVHRHLCCWILQMVVQLTGVRLNTKYLLLNTLRTGDADLRFYITTVQDG